jgi:excisionase family DNA binding protein
MVAQERTADMPVVTAERKFLRVREAAEYSGLSESEVYRSIYCGDLRALRFRSRSWLLTREDIDAWIAKLSVSNVAA